MSELSCARAQLVKLLQRISFGRIESLEIRQGEPVLSPPPTVVRELKFPHGDVLSQRHGGKDAYLLKSQLVQLFAQFDQLQNGVIEVLEVKHGLPFRMMVADVAA